MSKITLNNVADLTQTTTAATTINNNFSTLQTAFDNTLSRDGTAPDQMLNSLDMNNNQIVNLPTPFTANSPLRLQDASTLNGGGTIVNFPSGGTTGQVMTKNSNVNYDAGWTNSVTSVGLSLPSDFTISNSPVTTTGTLTGVWANTPTGTGAVVRATTPALTSPSMTNPTITGTVTGSGIITNTNLANMAASSIKLNSSTSAAAAIDTNPTALAVKTIPVSADTLIIADSAASNALKSITIGGILDFKTINVQKFTASGTYTPTANMLYCIIECVGGGGAGGSLTAVAGDWTSGSGGGGGAYARKFASAATIGASQVVTVGAAGAAGAAGDNAGGAGGQTSVGAICVAAGGGGGPFSHAAVQVAGGGLGGSTGTGDLIITGSPGGGGYGAAAAGGVSLAGWGGASAWGGGAATVTNANGAAAAANSGAGGSGAQDATGTTNRAGGAGGSGYVLITEFIH